MSDDNYSLDEFEAWCKGVGRGGNAAGWHDIPIAAIARFKAFMHRQEAKRKSREKHIPIEVD